MIKSITRFVSLAVLFLIPIFPLIVANSYFFPFITGKAFYFRILVEIAFAAWVILACIDSRYRPRINALSIGVTAFALIALVADLLGVNPIRSIWSNFERMEGWLVIVHLWMLYMVMSGMFGAQSAAGAGRSDSMSWWHRWMNAFLLVGFVVGCYGFAQLFGWAAVHQGSVRIDASLGNAAYMAVYMLMNAGMAAYLFFATRRERGTKGWKLSWLEWVYALGFLMFSFLLFETATRGTILGWIGGVMLSLVLYAWLAPKTKATKRARTISASVIGVIILIAIVFWANRHAAFIQKNDVLQRMANISWNETTSQARAYIWPMALKGFSERPILGWGQENFNYIFNANYNPKMWTQEQWFDRAHSVFLDWLVAAGLVGFLAYISLYVLSLTIIWRSDLYITEKSVLTGLIAGYAVHNIFVFDNLASYVAFFALLAFIGSALSSHEATAAKTAGSGKKRSRLHAAGALLGGNREVSADVVEYVVTPASILLLIAAIYFLNVKPIDANTDLITALQACSINQPDPQLFQNVFDVGVYIGEQEAREQLVSCASTAIHNTSTPAPTQQAFYKLATQAIDDQIKQAPKDARMYVLAGSFYNSVGNLEQGMSILEKAHALTPAKQNVDFELANDYINAGKPDKALALLKSAYEGDPTYPDAKQAYALGLIINGMDAQAAQLMADDPSFLESDKVGQIYTNLKKYDKALAIFKKIAAANPTDANAAGRVAQVEFLMGNKYAAVATLQQIAKDHPEMKAQVDQTIKQIQAQ